MIPLNQNDQNVLLKYTGGDVSQFPIHVAQLVVSILSDNDL